MIKTYSDIALHIIRCTESPAKIVCDAAAQCMAKEINTVQIEDQASLVKYLMTSEHHSIFEHASISFHLRGISRSLLAQLTRQRTFKFTSSSQHYQDYREYPNVIHQETTNEALTMYEKAFDEATDSYLQLLELGVPREEARQVLPNAAAVNLLVTADARNLMYFFKQRRCLRNVAEMVQVADAMWGASKTWFPELFSLVGAPCFMTGKCNQGRMMANACKDRERSDSSADTTE